MPFSAADALILAIKAQAEADDSLEGVHISDGFFVADDLGDVLMIGVSDVDGEGGNAIEGSRDWANTGIDGIQHEESSIQCVVTSLNGDGDQALARASVWAIGTAVADLCNVYGKTDPAFGLDYVLWTQMGKQFSVDLIQADVGAVAVLKFRIYYEARV